jgi:hypothetical protein
MIQTLNATACTVMLDSGLAGRFWFLALQYVTHIHNLQSRDSAFMDSSPYLFMYGVKPDASGNQRFGVEARVFMRPDQQQDQKFSKRGEAWVFLGYQLYQPGYLLWCSTCGNNCVVVSTNVGFGNRCLHASAKASGLFPDTTKELFLPELPTAFRLEEVHHTFSNLDID